MPLDRRITINILDFEGDTLALPVWAEETGAGSSDSADGGSFITQAVQNFLVRHDDRLAQVAVHQVSVTDRFGHVWDADSISLSDARDRFISIQAIRRVETTDIVDPSDPVTTPATFALEATEQTGIYRWARTTNQLAVSDYYNQDGFGTRMIATFVNDELVLSNQDGPFSTWSADEILDTAELNARGGPLSGNAYDGRTFDMPRSPSLLGSMAFLIVFWIDRGTPGERDNPDSVVSIAEV